jgi:hypothetical protein
MKNKNKETKKLLKGNNKSTKNNKKQNKKNVSTNKEKTPKKDNKKTLEKKTEANKTKKNKNSIKKIKGGGNNGNDGNIHISNPQRSNRPVSPQVQPSKRISAQENKSGSGTQGSALRNGTQALSSNGISVQESISGSEPRRSVPQIVPQALSSNGIRAQVNTSGLGPQRSAPRIVPRALSLTRRNAQENTSGSGTQGSAPRKGQQAQPSTIRNVQENTSGSEPRRSAHRNRTQVQPANGRSVQEKTSGSEPRRSVPRNGTQALSLTRRSVQENTSGSNPQENNPQIQKQKFFVFNINLSKIPDLSDKTIELFEINDEYVNKYIESFSDIFKKYRSLEEFTQNEKAHALDKLKNIQLPTNSNVNALYNNISLTDFLNQQIPTNNIINGVKSNMQELFNGLDYGLDYSLDYITYQGIQYNLSDFILYELSNVVEKIRADRIKINNEIQMLHSEFSKLVAEISISKIENFEIEFPNFNNIIKLRNKFIELHKMSSILTDFLIVITGDLEKMYNTVHINKQSLYEIKKNTPQSVEILNGFVDYIKSTETYKHFMDNFKNIQNIQNIPYIQKINSLTYEEISQMSQTNLYNFSEYIDNMELNDKFIKLKYEIFDTFAKLNNEDNVRVHIYEVSENLKHPFDYYILSEFLKMCEKAKSMLLSINRDMRKSYEIFEQHQPLIEKYKTSFTNDLYSIFDEILEKYKNSKYILSGKKSRLEVYIKLISDLTDNFEETLQSKLIQNITSILKRLKEKPNSKIQSFNNFIKHLQDKNDRLLKNIPNNLFKKRDKIIIPELKFNIDQLPGHIDLLSVKRPYIFLGTNGLNGTNNGINGIPKMRLNFIDSNIFISLFNHLQIDNEIIKRRFESFQTEEPLIPMPLLQDMTKENYNKLLVNLKSNKYELNDFENTLSSIFKDTHFYKIKKFIYLFNTFLDFTFIIAYILIKIVNSETLDQQIQYSNILREYVDDYLYKNYKKGIYFFNMFMHIKKQIDDDMKKVGSILYFRSKALYKNRHIGLIKILFIIFYNYFHYNLQKFFTEEYYDFSFLFGTTKPSEQFMKSIPGDLEHITLNGLKTIILGYLDIEAKIYENHVLK